MSIAVSNTPERVMLTADAVGGVWSYALDLTRMLVGRGISVALVTLGPPPSAAQRRDAASAGAELQVTSLPLDWTAASERDLDDAAAELQRRALECRADLVHIHAPALIGTEGWPLPVVTTAHSCVATWWAKAGNGALPPDLAWRARRTSDGLAHASGIIAPSRSFALDIAETYGRHLPIVVVHNGRKQLPSIVEETGASRALVLTAGRLWDRGKNVRVLDEAARIGGTAIYAAGPRHDPTGCGQDFPNLQLLGNLDEREMRRWHRRAGIFVSASLYEPFGLAVLEAAQASTALVLADLPTFRELWDGAAEFFDPHDASALASLLAALAMSERRRGALARAAAARARRYSCEAMGERTLALYRHVLGSRRLASGGLCA